MEQNNRIPKIAVIVSNYNCWDCLKDCLGSLAAQDYPDYRVFLMDNASTDGSVEFASKAFPQVTIIANHINYGFAGGYNRAVHDVDAEFIAIINSDTIAAKDWLSTLYRGLIEERAAIAGSKICFMEDPRTINSAGKKLTYSGIGTDIGYGMKDGPEFNRRGEIAALCGAAMMFNRAAFLSLEGFDEDYFILCEDTDLCWRAWLSGLRVVYVPRSSVLHRFGESIGKRESPVRVFYSQRNAILIVVKDFGAARLLLSGLVISCYTLLKALLFLFSLKFKSLNALISGTGSALRLLPSTLKKRRLVQSQRVLSDAQLQRKGFILPLTESIREYVRVSGLRKL